MSAPPALRIGPLTVDPPVVLAPMAGVTNVPFRLLCRRHGGGLFVSEMVGARALLEGDERTLLRAAFAPEESPRSIQLYAVDPAEMRDGVAWLVERGRVDHIDLNFGCPVPKVTRHGGGAARPWKLDLFHAVVAAAAAAAGPVPVTVKMRTGIDADHLTHLDAGRAARDAGAAAVALHARTAEQAYSGRPDLAAIAALVEALPEVPVLGNGDVFGAGDALEMMARTGCAGVVIGRGCLGRPWLFAELAAAFAGDPLPPPPTLGEVADELRRHAVLLVDHFGELVGLRELRKHTGWYLQGFIVGKAVRRALRQVATLEELDRLLVRLDRSQVLPADVLQQPRGHTHGPKPVRLPHRWLDDRATPSALDPAAAAVVSGG